MLGKIREIRPPNSWRRLQRHILSESPPASTELHPSVVTCHRPKVRNPRIHKFWSIFWFFSAAPILVWFWWVWNISDYFSKKYFSILDPYYLLTCTLQVSRFTVFLHSFLFSFLQKFIGVYRGWWVWHLSGLFPQISKESSKMISLSSFFFLYMLRTGKMPLNLLLRQKPSRFKCQLVALLHVPSLAPYTRIEIPDISAKFLERASPG